MKAIIRTKAGKNLSNMQVQEVEQEELLPHQVRVKMVSSRINPVDIDLMKGMPFLNYKKPQIGGIDGAGEVIASGAKVQNFQAGDQVFFYRKFTDIGTWAEEIVINAADVAKIPENVSTKEAGAIALPLLTAFDALTQLEAKTDERILIHGAAGGVGFQAVQLAKKMGLKLVATAGPKDVEILEKAGVEQIINYREADFSEVLETGELDYVFDVLGKEVLLKSLALKPKKVVSVAYVDTEKMGKTGIKMPGILKFIMKLAMGKFRRVAKKHGVQIIGQVTGANGKMLQAASDMLSESPFISRSYQELSLSEIESKGFPEKSVGKLILFS
ncbi:MAG: NADP-dependent oxidoreductase [Bacteroidota bacterium]